MRMKIGHVIVKMEGLLDPVTEMMSHDTDSELHLRGPHGIINMRITLVESDINKTHNAVSNNFRYIPVIHGLALWNEENGFS